MSEPITLREARRHALAFLERTEAARREQSEADLRGVTALMREVYGDPRPPLVTTSDRTQAQGDALDVLRNEERALLAQLADVRARIAALEAGE